MARPFKQQRDPSALKAKAPVFDPDAVPQRLHKLLALAGLGSRRDMEALIANGRVTINGQVAAVGAGVVPTDVVRVDSRPVRLPFEAELPRVLIYHKPEGEIVSADDPEGRDSVFDKLPKIRNGKWIAIGRLDINTSGLLMFTTSGELANHFMHPRYEVEREYAVRIYGELTEGQLLQLQQGIELEDGPAQFDHISPQGGEGSNHWYQVILREGRNREVRRLFEAFQMPVSRLMRVRFGPVNLPPRVKRGMMLELDPKEVIGLLEWAGLETPKGPMRQRTAREKDKAGATFVPKPSREARLRKANPRARVENSRAAQPSLAETLLGTERKTRRPSSPRKPSATGAGGAPASRAGASKPAKPSTSRRIRQSTDIKPMKSKR